MGALSVFSFKGQPYEVGTVLVLQKKKLRLSEVMGITGTGTQVSGSSHFATKEASLCD